MYRDSFGNTLLPYFADAYENAYFSRGIPYQLSDVDTNHADTVIIERAERFLPEMSQFPPVLIAKETKLSGVENVLVTDGACDVKIKTQGTNVQITGRIKEGYLDTDSQIYLRVNGIVYEAFPMGIQDEDVLDDKGFCLYLSSECLTAEEDLGDQIEILIKKEKEYLNIYQNMIKKESMIQ